MTVGPPPASPSGSLNRRGMRLSENQMPNRGFGLLQGVAELGDERHDGAANRGADVVFRFERRASNEVIAISAMSESYGNTTTSAQAIQNVASGYSLRAKSRNCRECQQGAEDHQRVSCGILRKILGEERGLRHAHETGQWHHNDRTPYARSHGHLVRIRCRNRGPRAGHRASVRP